MIRALGTPIVFAGLVLGFLLGCAVHAGVQRWAILRWGAGSGRWLLPAHAGVARYVDPFGAVAAALGGIGWQTPLEPSSYQRVGKWRLTALILLGPLANFAIAVVGYALWVHVASLGGTPSLGDLLHGHLGLRDAGPTLLAAIAGVNLQMAILTLLPLPPLDGARIMFLHAPRTVGWQKAEYYLVERNYGMVAVLVLLLLPVGGGVPPLVQVVDTIGSPIATHLLRAFGG